MEYLWLHVVVVNFVWVLCAFASPLQSRATAGISQTQFEDMKWYFQYAASTYSSACPKPNGQVLVSNIRSGLTDTQGFIARDDTRQEIVVALRGSSSFVDILTDIAVFKVPLVSSGIKAPSSSMVHAGFLNAYNSVASEVLDTVRSHLQLFPGYRVVTSGHSLGGSLASIAALSLQQNFPQTEVLMYTYGQPRTFNSVGAEFVNQVFGSRAHRSVHADDGVPFLLAKFLGFAHHGKEYWQFQDPPVPANVMNCDPRGEDPNCSSRSSLSGVINTAHSMYYGVWSQSAFCA